MFNKKMQIDEEVFEDFVQKGVFLILQDNPRLEQSELLEKLLNGMKNRQQFEALSQEAVGYDFSRRLQVDELIAAGVWDALVRLVEKCVDKAFRHFIVDYYAEMLVEQIELPDEIEKSELHEQVLAAAYVKKVARNIVVHNRIENLVDLKRIVKEEFIKKYSAEKYEEMNDAGRGGYQIEFDLETMHMTYTASIEDGRIKDAFRRYNFENKT